MCMLKYLLIKLKKNFECFICCWKWFYSFVLFSFCLKCIFVFFFKNWFRGLFTRSLQLRAFREMCLREIKSHIFIQKLSLLSREYFATKLFSWNVFQQKLKIFKFIQKLSQLSRYWFVTKSFSRKLLSFSGPFHDFLMTVSLLSNPRKMCVFSFYAANVTCFQKLFTSLA